MDAHSREAAAAAAGMAETYGRPAEAIGSRVWFSPTPEAIPIAGVIEESHAGRLAIRDERNRFLHLVERDALAPF